jgi:hypothetical protein
LYKRIRFAIVKEWKKYVHPVCLGNIIISVKNHNYISIWVLLNHKRRKIFWCVYKSLFFLYCF